MVSSPDCLEMFSPHIKHQLLEPKNFVHVYFWFAKVCLKFNFRVFKNIFFCKYQSRITILPALPSGRILLFHSLFWDFVHLCTSLYIFLFLEISRKWTGKLIYRLFQYIHVYLKNPSFYNVHKIDIKSDQAASIKRSLTQ